MTLSTSHYDTHTNIQWRDIRFPISLFCIVEVNNAYFGTVDVLILTIASMEEQCNDDDDNNFDPPVSTKLIRGYYDSTSLISQ